MNRPPVRRLVVLLAALVVGPAVAARPALADEGAAPVACGGEFDHDGGDEDLRARDRAIDEAVAGLNFLWRGIARSRLREATPIVRRLSVRREGDRTVTVLDGRRYATEADGRPTEVTTPAGDRVTLTHRWRDGRLEQRFRAGEGERVNLYRCEGGRLEVEVAIRSSRLPRDVRYRLRYRRR